MSTPAELDWCQLSLEGTTLIEASAGTGKTYNIALLYLRLMLQRELGVEQILVTTFTDAAAQELKARIRQRLLDVLGHLQAVPTAAVNERLDDPSLAAFIDALAAERGTDALQRRLRMALVDIDRAPIFTIHGCCRRILTDFPFESGAPFVAGEIVDQRTLVAECVEDYWRQRFLGDAEPDLELAGSEAELQTLTRLVLAILDLPPERVQLPPADAPELPELLRPPHGPKAIEALLGEGWLKPSTWALSNALRALARYIERHQGQAMASFAELDKLHDYLNKKLDTQAKPEHLQAFDAHPLVQALRGWLESLRSAPDSGLARLAVQAREFVAAELPRRLAQRRQGTFDSLIDSVHARLHGPDGATLAERAGKQWPALLIDEFQDTDRRQWEIFARLHGARAPGDEAPRCLVLIGDPKQSIYGFRGGDIHTYLQVRAGLPADRVYAIQRNFRSHPRLLEALNGIYQRAGTAAFADSGIDYLEVRAGQPERWTDDQQRPLRLRLLVAPEHDTKAERDALAIAACAADIADLLSRSSCRAGEIAVLLDTNAQVRQLRRALIERRLPVVGAGRAAVLDGELADDVQLLLHALLHLGDGPALRGALATRLLGCSAADLQRLATETTAWEAQLDRFARWQALWAERGVLAVIETIISEQAPRLLADVDGERALTDLRHIGELLQLQAADCFGPAELYARLLRLRREGLAQSEASRELQLRIESEASRVQLLTVHSAKGLEFPIIFLPLAWRHRGMGSQDIGKLAARYQAEDGAAAIDLGTVDFAAHQAMADSDRQAERMRLLYVALTRAQQQCWLYSFADLGGQADPGPLERLLRAARQGLDWEALWPALTGVEKLEADAPAGSRPSPSKDDHPRPPRQARALPLGPRASYALYSFTSLVSQRSEAAGAAGLAEDEAGMAGVLLESASAAAPHPHPQLQSLAAVRGPRFGNAVHRLLEDGRGAQRYADHPETIAAALGSEVVRLEGGEEAAVHAAIAAMLDRTVDAELAPSLRLAGLRRSEQRAEFAFSFSLQQARWGGLSALLAEHELGHWWPSASGPQSLNGLMKGYIDLVFGWGGRWHVLDYKTNDLGQSLADYAPDALDRAMSEHHYGLQALLYSVALHRYLGRRLEHYDPAAQLGDSWYLFVRAIGLEAGAGVWRRRFPVQLIVDLDRLLGADSEGEVR